MLKRHGSWVAACAAAGLRSVEPSSGRKELGTRHGSNPSLLLRLPFADSGGLLAGFGSATFSEAELISFVEAYAADQATAGQKVTVAGYHEWALARRHVGQHVSLSGAMRTRLIGRGKPFSTWSELIDSVRNPVSSSR